MMIKRAAIFLLIIHVSGLLFSQEFKKISYRQAFSYGEPRLTERLPQIYGWHDEDSFLMENYDEAGNEQILLVDAESGQREIFLDFSELNKNIPDDFNLQYSIEINEDYSKFLLVENGDIYCYHKDDNLFSRLTEDVEKEVNPRFSPDGSMAAFTKNNDLYLADTRTGDEVQLTFDGSETIMNGYASWVYYEEILGRTSNYRAFYWSPDSKKIAFLKFDDDPVPRFPLYNADGPHGSIEWQRYPKAGDPNPFVELKLADVESGEIIDIDNSAGDHYIAWTFFSPASDILYYQKMNRDQDSIRIIAYDIKNNSKKTVYFERQDSWVTFFEGLHILQDGNGFILRSSRDGWTHCYHYSADGKLIDQITSGEWNVTEIAKIDEDEEKVYFITDKGRSWNRQLYSVDFDGGDLTQLTFEEGSHSAIIAPGGEYIIDTYSSVLTPKRIDILDAGGDFLSNIADSKTQYFGNYKFTDIDFFTIKSEDGYDLPALRMMPPDFDENRKYPVIIKIYGGPENSSVRNYFRNRRGQYQDYFIAQEGIIVMAVDNRGAGHLGKKAAAMMHRNLGKYELKDLISAVKWLKTKSYVDTAKIGITGGSYGGYVTCLAMVKAPEHFKYGLAKYSVTDWRLYDNVYTERYMDHPDDNPAGYDSASVMTYASNYEGGLYISHGTLDDNVHFQHVLQLINDLQNRNKDFDLMIYPNERHGYFPPKSFHSTREDLEFWFRNLLDRKLPE